MAQTSEETRPISINDDPEMFHGLTIWCGEPGHVRVSVQVRGAGALALYLWTAADRSTENGHPAILPVEDARRIRDLLNVATARGML